MDGKRESMPWGSNDSRAQDKSWYVATILARMGRPCTPREISDMCTFFCITPDEVLYLCRIPGSPLSLSVSQGHVTFSHLSVSAFDDFITQSAPHLRKKIQCEPLLKSPRKRSRALGETRIVSNKVRKVGAQCKQPFLLGIGEEAVTKSGRSGVGDRSPPPPGEGEMLEGIVNGKLQTRTCGNDSKVTENGMGLYGYKEKKSSLFEGIAIVGVAETAVVDVNMANANVNTENNPSCTNLMRSSQIPDWKFDDKNDCFLTYKRRRGNVSETQLDCMDKEAILHSNIEKAGVIKTSKFKDEDIKYDNATLGDITVSIQAQISSHKINLNQRQEVSINNINSGNVKSEPKDNAMLKPNLNPEMQTSKPKEEGLKDDCVTLVGDAEVLLQPCISSINSVIENITKLCDAKSEQKESQILESRLNPELASNKVEDFKISSLPRTKNSCPNNEKMHHDKQKTKNTRKARAVIGDKIVDTAVPASATNAVGSKSYPLFESFIVEEEEGSGGYGTVYKARRKQDGKIFAIKCPLEKTSTNYVTNEIKMLERFRGKNFIIKYEGFFKYNDCDCLILQHIEHDKPEVLKREIDISQLRWYGYCMFRALQSLHKEGIVHRDIKPGNFLFSRKSNKGYLIDFNLAVGQLDINFGRSKSNIHLDNQKTTVSTASQRSQFFTRKDTPDLRQKALLAAADATTVEKQTRQADNKRSSNGLNLKRGGQTLEIKQQYSSNHKAQNNLHPDTTEINHMIKSGERSVAKVTGLHLVVSPSREITSAHSPSGGYKREPLPNQGRKELLNLIHEAQQNPQQQSSLIPFTQRKRVAAPQERVRRDNGYTMNASPMPIQSKMGTSGYGLNNNPKNRDNQKFKREGPCVGTKGYRAPEVLLRSLHQGCKVDIWSAGVSLLYLIAGKTPFQTGNPDQAIKDIAKIRGMEEIWELAKLHDREMSLPEDLYSDEFVNMSVQEWCRKNTKRPDLFENTPPPLYDLIDKCLCVNPRQRIDASEALQHEFFAPCYGTRRSSSRSRESVLTE